MTSVTALEWTPEGLTTSIVTTQLVVEPHGVFKTWATSVTSINAVSCSAVMKRVEWELPFQVMMEPNSKLAPLTVRGNEGVEPAERATIVGEIVLIEGGGGGGKVIGMLPLHPPLTSQMAAKAKARRTKFDNFSTWNSQKIVTRITCEIEPGRLMFRAIGRNATSPKRVYRFHMNQENCPKGRTKAGHPLH